MSFLLVILNYPFGVTIQRESPFRIAHFISLFRPWTVEEIFSARLKRGLTTDFLCCNGYSNLKLCYLSERLACDRLLTVSGNLMSV